MKTVPVEEALGLILCHDITEIVPGEKKGPAFRRGHRIRPEDVEHLLRLGKRHIYVWEDGEQGRGLVHEDDAARRIAAAVAGPGLAYGEPKEGRINFTAAWQGFFQVDVELLNRLNSIPDVTIATARSMQEATPGRALAGTRVIPLAVPESALRAVEECCRGQNPLLRVLPFKKLRIGVVTTGSEVFHGRVKDAFGPVLRQKAAAWGSEIVGQEIVSDEPPDIAAAIIRFLEAGADLVTVTGGMSVDPDDRTPAAIRSVADEVVIYGAPVFPGAMFMLGYRQGAPIMGLPGCVMYSRASLFDLVMPRVLAGLRVTRSDILNLAHGGLCENCAECRYPHCAFGKQ